VGKDSEASLMLETETSVHLSENSDLKIKEIGANKSGGFVSRLLFMTGKLLADVKKNLQSSNSTFEVEANGVVCGVRGTAFEVNVSGDDSQVSTHEGKVEVSGGNDSHLVEAGNFSSFKKGRFQLLRRLDRMDIQRFQRWRALRQVIRQKRIQRLAAIRSHVRQPWRRLHPRLNNADPNLQQELKKKMKRKFLHNHH
jgi:ferric-dicitrate binding protein FerR (iron transport regulator)